MNENPVDGKPPTTSPEPTGARSAIPTGHAYTTRLATAGLIRAVVTGQLRSGSRYRFEQLTEMFRASARAMLGAVHTAEHLGLISPPDQLPGFTVLPPARWTILDQRLLAESDALVLGAEKAALVEALPELAAKLPGNRLVAELAKILNAPAPVGPVHPIPTRLALGYETGADGTPEYRLPRGHLAAPADENGMPYARVLVEDGLVYNHPVPQPVIRHGAITLSASAWIGERVAAQLPGLTEQVRAVVDPARPLRERAAAAEDWAGEHYTRVEYRSNDGQFNALDDTVHAVLADDPDHGMVAIVLRASNSHGATVYRTRSQSWTGRAAWRDFDAYTVTCTAHPRLDLHGETPQPAHHWWHRTGRFHDVDGAAFTADQLWPGGQADGQITCPRCAAPCTVGPGYRRAAR